MNIIQAEAIVSLYEELIKAIPHDKLTPPEPDFGMKCLFKMKSSDPISIEDQMIKVQWVRKLGHNEFDYKETFHSVQSIFNE